MKTEIDKNKDLQAGDVIEMHFRASGIIWLRAIHWALIERKLAGDSRFKILRWENTTTHLIVQLKILDPDALPPPQSPIPQGSITAAMIAIGIVSIAAGLMLWLTLDKVYQITETTGGKIMGISALLIPILILILLLRRQ